MTYGAIKDYYFILGVAENASYDEIKLKYRELVKRWHPDNCKELNAHDKFVEIAEAYEILKSTETRILYDRERAEYRNKQNSSYGGYGKSSTYGGHKNTDNDTEWEQFLKRQKEANQQAEYYANQSVEEVLAYLKDRILYGQSALRGNLGFRVRSLIGFRALFYIVAIIVSAATLVGAPVAIHCFFALKHSLTYKGYYIGVVTLLCSALLALVELILILFVISLI